MVLFVQSGCVRAKVVVMGQSSCVGKTVCTRAKVVVFEQKWLYLGKSGFILAKVVVFGQSGCIRSKVVVF